MAGYLIANYTITNEEAYQGYIAAVGAVTVVLKFPSMQALQGWYDSPEYREILPLRTDNTEGTVVFADEFVMPG
jgi:uncharacterized protein (DUF1330 family)